MVPVGTDLLECKQPWITVGSLFPLHKATEPWEQPFIQLVIIRVHNTVTATQLNGNPTPLQLSLREPINKTGNFCGCFTTFYVSLGSDLESQPRALPSPARLGDNTLQYKGNWQWNDWKIPLTGTFHAVLHRFNELWCIRAALWAQDPVWTCQYVGENLLNILHHTHFLLSWCCCWSFIRMTGAVRSSRESFLILGCRWQMDVHKGVWFCLGFLPVLVGMLLPPSAFIWTTTVESANNDACRCPLKLTIIFIGRLKSPFNFFLKKWQKPLV